MAKTSFEFAITANLRHGKPLTSSEYENALRRLKNLHPDWTQTRLGEALSRSRQWVSDVLASDRVWESALITCYKLGSSGRNQRRNR